MDETPIFALPFPVGGEDPPDGAGQIQAAVERVEELLGAVEHLITGAPAPGNLVVVNGTSDPVYKAVTGDVAISSAGVTTIGAAKVLEAMLGGESVATAKIKNLAVTAAKLAAEAVETAKLANLSVTEAKLAALAVSAAKLAAEAVETGKIKNEAVTTAKIKLLAITEALIADGAVGATKLAKGAIQAGRVKCTGKLVTTGAYQDVPGASKEIDAPRASLLLVTMTFDFFAPESVDLHGVLNVGGVVQTPKAFFHTPNGIAGFIRPCTSQTVVAEIPAGKTTVKLQAKRNGVELVIGELEPENTGYTYQLLPN